MPKEKFNQTLYKPNSDLNSEILSYSPEIIVEDLRKNFEVSTSERGLRGALKGLFRPKKKEIEAVSGISFQVKKGERIAFIGPNGAGKSTTIKMLVGILYPTSGRLEVAGLNPQKDRQKLAYKIGTVFGQKSQLWPHLPVINTFNLLSQIYDLEESIYQNRLRELVDIFKIDNILEQTVRKMSLGQRMRCEIVASLLHNPQILFLDEPTIGLDVAAKAVIRDLIRKMSIKDGTTVFLTSHDTGDMESVCDRVIVINEGQILIDNSILDMRKTFIQKKQITLFTQEENISFNLEGADLEDTNLEGALLEGIHILEREPHKIKLEVDTKKLSVDLVISEALRQSRLRDITVEDPPMEDIIHEIYQNF